MTNEYSVSLANCIAYAVTLLADDDRFSHDVEVRHEDGSLWYLRKAFSMPDPENTRFIWIITEHFSEQVYDADEVTVNVLPAGPRRDYVAAQDHIEKFDDLKDSEFDDLNRGDLIAAYEALREHHIAETGTLYARLKAKS